MKRILALMMVMVLFLGCGLTNCIAAVAENAMTIQQQNAINMLNYLRALAQEIRFSSNSRLYLEDAYSSLLNNTHPNAVDDETQYELLALLDVLENYRMIAVKRECLEYIYEQNCAQAIREAVPNPLAVLSTVKSFNPYKLAMSVVYMAVDSATSYQSAASAADLQYLQDGWQLDDEESANIHNMRTELWNYMINMVHQNDLNGDQTLSEQAVDDFVKWKQNDNLDSKIQSLVSHKNTYEAFGTYWLELADCYYQNGDYAKCLDAIEKYEDLNVHIFRKDHGLAKIMPLAIFSAQNTMSGKQVIRACEKYIDLLLKNTDDEEWSLRYFAAQSYLDLYARNGDGKYLSAAYNIALNNVNYLVEEQKTQNAKYLEDVIEIKAEKGATKQRKKEIENYNKLLKEERKTALPPLYEPLLLNCDLLFALAEKIGISEVERARINRILFKNEESLFLVEPIDELYRMDTTEKEYDLEFNGYELVLPAKYVSKNAKITIAVHDDKSTIFDDWTLQRVERKGKNDSETFAAVYSSAVAKKHKYSGDEKINIEILPDSALEMEPIRIEMQAVRKKVVEFLNTWNWLDDASKWTDSIVFQKVTE